MKASLNWLQRVVLALSLSGCCGRLEERASTDPVDSAADAHDAGLSDAPAPAHDAPRERDATSDTEPRLPLCLFADSSTDEFCELIDGTCRPVNSDVTCCEFIGWQYVPEEACWGNDWQVIGCTPICETTDPNVCMQRVSQDGVTEFFITSYPLRKMPGLECCSSEVLEQLSGENCSPSTD